MTKLFLFIHPLLFLMLVHGCYNSSEKLKNYKTMDKEQLTDFATKYTAAWCSQKPESVATFFAKTGSLKVNDGAPAVGREAITKVAESFMTAFPDIIVAMDSLVIQPNGIAYHWTLTGTNKGVGGTGNKVKISGFELWQMSDDGFIHQSIGSFDANEYNRQLKGEIIHDVR